MHIDLYIALAGLIVGFIVGMTGMGGGALMTPILVLLFKIDVGSAVTSDLVAALVMKPVGGGVHIARKTVNWTLVRWLCVGSVPGAIGGTLILAALHSNENVGTDLKLILGAVLLLAASTMVLKGWLQARRTTRERAVVSGGGILAEAEPIHVNPPSTILIGALGGVVVGMTSVGSGSLIIVLLMLLYPMLKGSDLVGTDLVQAVPLVAAAAVSHLLFLHDFQMGLTASILIGSVPGVYFGARLSSKAPTSVIRSALVFVLVASGLKLLNLPTGQLGVVMLAFALLALPVWGAIDAAGRPQRDWHRAGLSRRLWVGLQAAGALFGIGFGAAIAYFAKARPRLEAAAVPEPIVPVPVPTP